MWFIIISLLKSGNFKILYILIINFAQKCIIALSYKNLVVKFNKKAPFYNFKPHGLLISK